MKKISKLSMILLSLALAFSCCLPAFASAGFDASVLRNGKDVLVIDAFSTDKQASYTIQSILENDKYYHSVSDGILLLCPCVGEVDGHAMLSLCVLAFLDKEPYPNGINIQEITLEINGKSYTFSNLTDREIPLDSVLENATGEGSFAILNTETLSVMETLVENRQKTVHVSIKSESNTWNFDLAREEVDSIIHLYNLYSLAGGTGSENLKWLPAGSGAHLETK